jgi:hypothetical protein
LPTGIETFDAAADGPDGLEEGSSGDAALAGGSGGDAELELACDEPQAVSVTAAATSAAVTAASRRPDRARVGIGNLLSLRNAFPTIRLLDCQGS